MPMPFTMQTQNSLFITLEGGEGAGKSTLAKALGAALAERNIKTKITREPGGAPLAEQIRTLILDADNTHQWSPMSEALLMNAARREHLRTTIIPALDMGRWVICDRFMDSTRAYQANVSKELLDMLEQQIVTRRPDLTILLDAAPEDLLARRNLDTDRLDRFEQRALPFHRRVRARFIAIAKAEPDRVKVVSALDAVDDILRFTMSHINGLMPAPVS